MLRRLAFLILAYCCRGLEAASSNEGCNSTSMPEDVFSYLTLHYGYNGTFHFYQLYNLITDLSGQNNETGHDLRCRLEDIFKKQQGGSEVVANVSDFSSMCPDIVRLLIRERSQNMISTGTNYDLATLGETPSRLSIWGFGCLSVTIISLCSLVGISVLPLMRRAIYNEVLLYLIALAVGTLSSNAAFQLIPEGFDIHKNPTTVWRSGVILAGCYLFYLAENLLKLLFNRKKVNDCDEADENDVEMVQQTFALQHGIVSPGHFEDNAEDFHPIHANSCETNSDNKSESALVISLESTTEKSDSTSVCSAARKQFWMFRNYKSIKTVAWMITIADGIHNFIDGLAIGASFSTSIPQGLSTSAAIFCEEFPHELGDFAILLSAGMTVKQAAFFNFASACCCYVGLAVGVVLGHNESSARWIFSLAGGVFLYISLAEMLPEAYEQAKHKKLRKSPWRCFLLQNLGLLTGFMAIFILTLYKDSIAG